MRKAPNACTAEFYGAPGAGRSRGFSTWTLHRSSVARLLLSSACCARDDCSTIPARLQIGDYIAVHTYGWTEFQIDPGEGAL
jgi:hypothetical protein